MADPDRGHQHGELVLVEDKAELMRKLGRSN